MCDLGFGAGETDTKPFNFAEPAFPFGFGDPVEEVVAISTSLPRCAGSGRTGEQRTQAWSWIQAGAVGTVGLDGLGGVDG